LNDRFTPKADIQIIPQLPILISRIRIDQQGFDVGFGKHRHSVTSWPWHYRGHSWLETPKSATQITHSVNSYYTFGCIGPPVANK